MKNIFKFLIIFLFFALDTNANEISTAMYTNIQPWDIQKYYIDFDCGIMNDTMPYINGKCFIDVKQDTISPGNKFFFRLEHLQINKLQLNGKDINYLKKTDVFGTNYFEIDLAKANERYFTVYVEYSGNPKIESGQMPWGGVQVKDTIIYNLGVGFYNKNVYMGSFWFPCYDHPSDKAKYEIKIRSNKVVAASGLLKSIVPITNEGKTTIDTVKEYTFEGNFPAATYMLGFAVADFEKLTFEDTKVPTEIYYTKANEASTKVGFKLLPKMVECFSNYYGDYPFERVGYVVTPTGSMEHQTMIALAKAAISQYDTVSYIVAHELAHSWFGGSITTLDFRDVWIKEAFATFSEALWVEYLFSNDPIKSKDAYQQKLKINLSMIKGSSLTNKNAPVYNYDRDSNTNYPRIIYDKGAMIIHQIRQELGDELFFKAIKELNTQYKYSNITTDQFKKFLENYTNINLETFFNEWVYGRCYPNLELKVDKQLYPDLKYCKISFSANQIQKEPCSKFTKFFIDASLYGENREELKNLTIQFNYPEEIVTIDSLPNYKNIYFNLGRASVSLYNIAKVIESTSSVENTIIAEDSYSIYPEIAIDKININGDPIESQINIFNSLGQKVLSAEFSNQINIFTFAPGYYVLQIKNHYFKFIKI